MKNENLEKKLKKFFQNKKEFLFGYLFGSQAYQNTVKESDVDVALFLDEKKCSDFSAEKLKLLPQISRFLKKEADVLILNSAPPFLKYVVIKEGKLIFERSQGKRIDFELKTLQEYFDFQPVLEMYHQELLAK